MESFKCQKCDKTFKHRSKLLCHIYSHSDEYFFLSTDKTSSNVNSTNKDDVTTSQPGGHNELKLEIENQDASLTTCSKYIDLTDQTNDPCSNSNNANETERLPQHDNNQLKSEDDHHYALPTNSNITDGIGTSISQAQDQSETFMCNNIVPSSIYSGMYGPAAFPPQHSNQVPLFVGYNFIPTIVYFPMNGTMVTSHPADHYQLQSSIDNQKPHSIPCSSNSNTPEMFQLQNNNQLQSLDDHHNSPSISYANITDGMDLSPLQVKIKSKMETSNPEGQSQLQSSISKQNDPSLPYSSSNNANDTIMQRGNDQSQPVDDHENSPLTSQPIRSYGPHIPYIIYHINNDALKAFSPESYKKLQSSIGHEKNPSTFSSKKYERRILPLLDNNQLELFANSNEKPYKCQQCKKSFSRRKFLRRHTLIHTKAISGKKPFQCQECDKSFARKGSLQRHTYVHSGETRFQCKLCGKYFTRNAHLKNHITRIHTGKHCDASYKHLNDLVSHNYVHTDE